MARGKVSPAEGLILCFRVSEVVFGTAMGTEMQTRGISSPDWRRPRLSKSLAHSAFLRVLALG